MSVYSIGLVISLIVYLVVGAWAGRKVKHLDDYFVAGRQAPTILIVGTLVASLMSTNAFMGETGTAYGGFALVTIQLTAINVVGYIAGGHESWSGREVVAADPVRKGNLDVEIVSPHMYDPSGERMHG